MVSDSALSQRAWSNMHRYLPRTARNGSLLCVLMIVLASPSLSLSPLSLVFAQDIQPEPEPAPKSLIEGRRMFLLHCATCHGQNGTGNGPLARHLGIDAADLTAISKKNGGQFPFWPTYRIIDGREEVEEKGPRPMPAWGKEFLKQIGRDRLDAEELVRERILNLVHYVQSLQH